MRLRSRAGAGAVAALLALPLIVASSCQRKTAEPAAPRTGRATPAPVTTIRFTPMPDPPTPTVRPGQPTPPPDLPR